MNGTLIRILRCGVRTCAAVTGCAAVLHATPAEAQVPPNVRYQTLTTEHFRLSYEPGLDSLARHAVAQAEVAYAVLAERFGREPDGPIDIVLADNQDITNGTASPFPSNRIRLWARSSVGVEGLDFHADWMELVLVHELTHIFHLDVTGGLGRVMRSVFGRLPLLWPMFPAVGSPRWTTEGLAVVVESDLTGMGRVHGSHHEMVVRTDALEGGLESFGRVNASSPIWPGGQRPYIYGSLFLDWLRERHPDLGGEVLDATAGAVLPPLLFFDRVAQRAIGTSWDDAYAEWRAGVEEQAIILADSLGGTGLTLGERLTAHGWLAAYPRVSPDGSRLAYAAHDGRNVTATRVLALPARQPLGIRDEPYAQVRRNGMGTASWLPDGESLLVAQLEFDGPYHIVHDLWQVWPDGREERRTRGQRLEDADVAPDGERAIAVENGGGSTRLVQVDLRTGESRPITGWDPGVGWDLPRWSPDGQYIAVTRWEHGGLQDIIVIDTTGAVLRRLTADRAVDASPAWSPDGRWILFSSDRTGIANLYAAEWRTEPLRLRQVTNVLTGAFQPDVSRDGEWIHYAEYHRDGYHIARLPFDTRAWRPAPAPRPGYGPLPLVAGLEAGPSPASASSSVVLDPEDVVIAGPEPYSAWGTLAPTFWSPVFYDGGRAGYFVGVATAGEDLVGRHAFTAFGGIDPRTGVWEALFGYDYAGLGNPVLALELQRDQDFVGRVVLPDTTRRDVLATETTASLLARFVRRGWRSNMAFTVGIEGATERRTILDAPGFRLIDRADDLIGAVARVGFANTRQQPFSISAEDGVFASLATRFRRELGGDSVPASYRELTAFGAAYRSLDFEGFARHVLAGRVSGLARGGEGAGLSSVGGGSGTAVDLFGYQLGGSRLLPVRGFAAGDRAGTHAWTASLEYRFPLALVGQRPWWSPLFLDRLSGALFVDAGNAWCTAAQRAIRAACPGTEEGEAAVPPALISAGAELVLDAGLSFLLTSRLRIGVAAPLQGPRSGALLYVSLGPSF